MTDRQRLEVLHPRESRDKISMAEHTYICLKLLLTERLAIARMVKRLQGNVKRRPVGFERLDGYLMSCTDILKALDARAKT